MRHRLAAAAFFQICGLSAVALGGTIHVYHPDSIQAAIDQANPGDEILVHPGTYAERLDFHGKAVALRSSGGPAVTTLDGQQAGTVIVFHSGEGAGTIVDGFSIIGGQGANGGGMHILGASPTILNCVLRGNHAQYGGGLFVQSGQPTLRGCIIEQNVGSASGGGMYCFGYPGQAAATLDDCRFLDNTAESVGGGLRNWDTSPTLRRCVFQGNHARYSGAGVANGGASSPTITACTFDGNRADTLFANWDGWGGGMSNTDTSSPLLVNCLFVANSAVALFPHLSRGGALANSGAAQPGLINCTFVANHANIGGALWNSGTAQATVSSSILWSSGGGEIVIEGAATVLASYCAVQGGWPGTGNLSDDPRLIDHRLQSDSPCINAGDPIYAPAGGADLDGHARVLCARVDMGAYEFGIGDFNCDRYVDGQDFAAGTECMTGPDNPPYGPGCEALDFEYDLDIDLVDLAAIQAASE